MTGRPLSALEKKNNQQRAKMAELAHRKEREETMHELDRFDILREHRLVRVFPKPCATSERAPGPKQQGQLTIPASVLSESSSHSSSQLTFCSALKLRSSQALREVAKNNKIMAAIGVTGIEPIHFCQRTYVIDGETMETYPDVSGTIQSATYLTVILSWCQKIDVLTGSCPFMKALGTLKPAYDVFVEADPNVRRVGVRFLELVEQTPFQTFFKKHQFCVAHWLNQCWLNNPGHSTKSMGLKPTQFKSFFQLVFDEYYYKEGDAELLYRRVNDVRTPRLGFGRFFLTLYLLNRIEANALTSAPSAVSEYLLSYAGQMLRAGARGINPFHLDGIVKVSTSFYPACVWRDREEVRTESSVLIGELKADVAKFASALGSRLECSKNEAFDLLEGTRLGTLLNSSLSNDTEEQFDFWAKDAVYVVTDTDPIPTAATSLSSVFEPLSARSAASKKSYEFLDVSR
jgi:hypothetical protein